MRPSTAPVIANVVVRILWTVLFQVAVMLGTVIVMPIYFLD
jgi:hypothetical protein